MKPIASLSHLAKDQTRNQTNNQKEASRRQSPPPCSTTVVAFVVLFLPPPPSKAAFVLAAARARKQAEAARTAVRNAFFAPEHRQVRTNGRTDGRMHKQRDTRSGTRNGTRNGTRFRRDTSEGKTAGQHRQRTATSYLLTSMDTRRSGKASKRQDRPLVVTATPILTPKKIKIKK